MGDTETDSDLKGKSWKELFLRWTLNQGVSTVLLFAIFGVLFLGGRYAIETAIPSHLESIQHGYEKIEKSHQDAMKAERTERDTFLRYVIDSCCGAEKTKATVANP